MGGRRRRAPLARGRPGERRPSVGLLRGCVSRPTVHGGLGHGAAGACPGTTYSWSTGRRALPRRNPGGTRSAAGTSILRYTWACGATCSSRGRNASGTFCVCSITNSPSLRNAPWNILSTSHRCASSKCSSTFLQTISDRSCRTGTSESRSCRVNSMRDRTSSTTWNRPTRAGASSAGRKYRPNRSAGTRRSSSSGKTPETTWARNCGSRSVAWIRTLRKYISDIRSRSRMASVYGSGPWAQPASQIRMNAWPCKTGRACSRSTFSVCSSRKKNVNAIFRLSPLSRYSGRGAGGEGRLLSLPFFARGQQKKAQSRPSLPQGRERLQLCLQLADPRSAH